MTDLILYLWAFLDQGLLWELNLDLNIRFCIIMSWLLVIGIAGKLFLRVPEEPLCWMGCKNPGAIRGYTEGGPVYSFCLRNNTSDSVSSGLSVHPKTDCFARI